MINMGDRIFLLLLRGTGFSAPKIIGGVVGTCIWYFSFLLVFQRVHPLNDNQ